MSKFHRIATPFLALIIIVIGKYVIVAQTPVTGTWQASYSTSKLDGDKRKIRLTMTRKERNIRNQMGSTYELSDLRGLTESQVSGSNQSVRFSIDREAGNIEFEGTFNDGKGSGDFRFIPSQDFLAAMKSRGFDFTQEPKRGESSFEERIFAAATINVTTALADDLLSSGFGKIDIDDLFKGAIFKIDGKFAREMRESGFPNLSFDDLVKAKIFKIDADFLREVTKMGFQNESFETLVKMRIFKISPEYIAELRAEGLQDLDIEDVVKLRIFNIDAEFIRKARADGVPLRVEKLVEKKIGVYR